MRLKKSIVFITSVFLSTLLIGCMSPVKVDPPTTYEISSTPDQVKVKRKRPVTLLVMQPETSSAYNTTEMAYTAHRYQVAYFGQNRWAETPAQMLQPLMVQTLQNTGYFQAVVTPPYIGRYDYMLTTRVLKLQQDFTMRPAMVHLIVRAQLSRTSTNQVIATKQFVINEVLPTNTPYGGVIAANRATSRMLKQLATFCLENT